MKCEKIIYFQNNITLFLILIIMGLISCVKDGPTESVTDVNHVFMIYTNGKGEVGKGGARIEVTDEKSPLYGTLINIPAGAISEKTFVSISTPNENVNFYGNVNSIFVILNPIGLKFDKNIEVTLPYNPSIVSDPNKLEAFYYSKADTVWQNIKTKSVDTEKSLVIAEINHFSLFTASALPNIFEANLYKTIKNLLTARCSILNDYFTDIPILYGELKKYETIGKLLESEDRDRLYSTFRVELKKENSEDILSYNFVNININNTNLLTSFFNYPQYPYLNLKVEDYNRSALKTYFSGLPFHLQFPDYSPNTSEMYYFEIYIGFYDSESLNDNGLYNTRLNALYYNFYKNAKLISELETIDDNTHNGIVDSEFDKYPNIDDFYPQNEANGILPKNLTFTWKSDQIPGTTQSFKLFFYKGSELQPFITFNNITKNSFTLDFELDYSTNYKWAIKATNSHGYISEFQPIEFTTSDVLINQPPESPQLVSPSNGQTDISTSPELIWLCADPDNDSLIFDIYLGTTEEPEKIVSDFSSIEIQKKYSLKELIAGTKYFWKIVAKDDKDAASIGDIWTFTTKVDTTKPPTAVVLSQPTSVTSTYITLEWSKNNDPDFYSYKILYSTEPNIDENSNIAAKITEQETTSQIVYGLTNNTTYYFKVYVYSQNGLFVGSNEVSETTADVGNEFNIPDPYFEEAIRQILNKPIGKISSAEMLEIENFDANSKNISDITGIEYCKNLTDLNLSNNQISDLTPLKDLSNLSLLYIRDNTIVDLSPLQELTNLIRLSLENNQITDITPLKGLSNLIYLLLSQNQITDITPLKGLFNLDQLWLWDNQITDITPLKDLTNLTWLIILGNKISDLSPLQELNNLTLLYLRNNQIVDITPLQGLTNLTELFLQDNQISDITHLQNLINLHDLRINQNKITDILPLINNPGIADSDYIYLKDNPLSNISTDTYIPQLRNRGVIVDWQ